MIGLRNQEFQCIKSIRILNSPTSSPFIYNIEAIYEAQFRRRSRLFSRIVCLSRIKEQHPANDARYAKK